MTQLLWRLFCTLHPMRRRQLFALLALMLLASCAETISIALVLPFLTVLARPDQLFNQPLLKGLWINLGFVSPAQLLAPVSLFFIGAAGFSALIQIFTIRASLRLAANVGADLSSTAFSHCLSQPYAYHLTANSGHLVALINTAINIVVGNVLNPFLRLVGSLFVVIAVGTTLLVLAPVYSLGLATAVLLVYLGVARLLREPLSRLSGQQSYYGRLVVQALQEGFGSIRDILLDGTKDAFVSRFATADTSLRTTQAEISFVSSFPRILVELVALTSFATAGLIISLREGGLLRALPLLGLLLLSVQRLLPFGQKIYDSWALMSSSRADLTEFLRLVESPIVEAKPTNIRQISFSGGLELRNVYYRYEPGRPDVLLGLNLSILPGERVGLIGQTGSGKSTVLDLMMGLIQPSSGYVLVDGLDLHDSSDKSLLWGWRSAISHVPQSIFLSDQSIAENIAFGIPSEAIDYGRLREAADKAQALCFIDSLPRGFDTPVGERGIQLSGGQRQRLGIARALYKNAKVLILDEATSALDLDTERSVMAAIENLPRELTLIIVAHRLESLRFCDRILDVSMLQEARTGSC